MKRQLPILLTLLGFGHFPVYAVNDQTLSASATVVQIEVVNGCELNNTSSGTAALGTLNFGEIYRSNAIRDAVTSSGSGSLELRCTPGTTAKITMNAGLYGSSVSDRKMRINSGTATLAYQLYTSANRQTIWDDILGVSLLFSSDALQSIPVYGRIPIQATPVSGQYSDLVTVTVSY